ncbi:uncharacterized protein LOC122509174 [Leptopilina heterotoma]|uniref:uncharacterized protein LOC122509174 n=1 Tax=Leptopilina heterotoma TaxID=63436 RepID=UPI001CA98B49|nr:uncharacterized protein LOC122509174 [Leptopilina heterotoma]
MLKFMYLLLLTFSTKVKAQNGLYPLTNKFTITNYEIQPNNEFLQEEQRGFIMWMRTIARDTNEIKVYVQSLSVQQLLPAGDLCSPTFFFEYLRQLTAVLSNGRSCPIRTGTTIDIFKPYTENLMNPRKTCLGTQFLNFTLYDKLDKFKLITLEAETTSSGQACVNG